MITKKLTAQEAALYYGQECLVWFEQDPFEKENVNWQLLERIRHDYIACKLLLRPLSDITEEEAQAIDFKPNGFQTARKRAVSRFEFNKFNGHEIVFTAKDVQYLLSRGLDVFNWIEQGLAIDKTKLPTI
jgi:hypothetical protein